MQHSRGPATGTGSSEGHLSRVKTEATGKSKAPPGVCRVWGNSVCVGGLSRGRVGIPPTGSHSHLLAGPLRAVRGPAGRALACLGRGEGCAPGGQIHRSALSARSRALGHSAALAARQTQTCHLHGRGQDPGPPLEPSLTQADRFLLVFRVCFCLAPFEIGYDVGGKAAASKPRATSAQPRPVLAWKMDGRGAGGGGWGAGEGGHAVSYQLLYLHL